MRTVRWCGALVVLLAVTGVTRADAALRWLQAEISPYAGFWILDESIALREKPMVGVRGGLTFAKRIGIEGGFGTMDTDRPGQLGVDYQLDHIGVDLVLNLLPRAGFNPYLVGGWNQVNRNPERGETLRMGGYEFGGGVKVRLAQREGLRIDFRVDGRDVLVKSDVPLLDPGVVKAHVLISGGIQLSVSDADRDSDHDGILDRLDRCPATPFGAIVDPLGCPQDRDEDRVPDGLDACPYTPFGAVVDETGCPRDTDQDGVYDGLDRCERTPAGVRVDVVGCPVDSDGDGVYDGPDQCPGTPLGVLVDPQGCPVPVSPQEKELLDTGTLRLDRIYFEEGSAELKPESYVGLDAVGEILARWPQLEIEIGGHTDAQGDDEFNLVLSRSRAQAVYDYLASHFPSLRLGQFVVRGYGETQPVASNDTPNGRTSNRRVEFRVLNRGVLKR